MKRVLRILEALSIVGFILALGLYYGIFASLLGLAACDTTLYWAKGVFR